MGSTQVVWQNLYMVFWGLASLVFVLGFIQHMVESGDRWPHAIAMMALLIALAEVYPDATTSFMNLNESVRESLYPAGTNVSDLYTYMKNVKTKESSDSSWTADLRGMATYPIRKVVDEVLEYVCRTCIFIGELSSAVAVTIIAFTFKLFKVISPLLISFCYFKFTQSAGVRFLTLSLGLCLAPYAFVAADFMLIEIFSSLNTLITNTVLNNNAAAIVAVVADGATNVVPGGGTMMQIGSYLILSVVLGLMSIFVYIGAPACLLMLLSGESPANAAIMAAMAGGQTIQTLTGSAGDIANVGMSMAKAGSKTASEGAGSASAGVPLGVTEPLASTPVAGASSGTAAGASSVGASAATGAGATAATAGLAAPIAVAATAVSAAVQTAETAAKVAQQTASSAMETASGNGQVDGATSGPSLVPSSASTGMQNASSSLASNDSQSSAAPEASTPAPGPSSFNTSFADNPTALVDELRNAVETAKTEVPIPPEQPIDPNGYNRRKR